MSPDSSTRQAVGTSIYGSSNSTLYELLTTQQEHTWHRQEPIPIHFGQLFSHSCYAVERSRKVRDFDASSPDRFVQSRR